MTTASYTDLRNTLAELVDQHSLLEVLEALVDRHTLDYTVECIADVCDFKADHLRANWQEQLAAKSWEKDCNKLKRLRLEN